MADLFEILHHFMLYTIESSNGRPVGAPIITFLQLKTSSHTFQNFNFSNVQIPLFLNQSWQKTPWQKTEAIFLRIFWHPKKYVATLLTAHMGTTYLMQLWQYFKYAVGSSMSYDLIFRTEILKVYKIGQWLLTLWTKEIGVYQSS